MFKPDEVKELYKQQLREAKLKYTFLILNFCIMENHVHLMLKPTESTDLSALMQWINSMFTRRHNALYGTIGSLWRGRFRSEIIENDQYRRNVILYIWSNPHSIPEVEDVREYVYSGFYCMKIESYELLAEPDEMFRECFEYMAGLNLP